MKRFEYKTQKKITAAIDHKNGPFTFSHFRDLFFAKIFTQISLSLNSRRLFSRVAIDFQL